MQYNQEINTVMSMAEMCNPDNDKMQYMMVLRSLELFARVNKMLGGIHKQTLAVMCFQVSSD